jgi:hypothetical protein
MVTSFRTLTSKWWVFHGLLYVSLGFADDTVKARVVLDNFVRVRDGFRFKGTLDIEGLDDLQRKGTSFHP